MGGGPRGGGGGRLDAQASNPCYLRVAAALSVSEAHTGQFLCFGPRSCFIAFVLDLPSRSARRVGAPSAGRCHG
jgi:hypothetical protein